MSKRKLLIAKIAAVLLIILIVCTIVSKSIYTTLLPKVRTYSPTNGTLNESVSLTGEYAYLEAQDMKATGNWEVLEVKANNDKEIKKGDPIFVVDISNDAVSTSRLELAVLQLKNQLNPQATKKDTVHKEMLMQLDIAQKDLDLYNNQYPNDSRQRKAQLEQAILDAKAQVKLSDEMYDYQALLLNLRAAQSDLSEYRRANPSPDEGQIDELQLKIDNCQHQVDVYLASNYQNNVLKSRLNMAEEALEVFNLTQDKKNQVEQDRLELQVLKLNNELEGIPSLDEQQITVIKKQLAIAEQELTLQKTSYPQKGIVTAPVDGTLRNFSVKQGEKLTQDSIFAQIVPQKSTSCVRWEMDYEAGVEFNIGNKIVLMVMTSEPSKQKQISSTITSMKINPKTKKWSMEAIYNEPEGIIKGIQPTVKLASSSEQYEIIVPLSCVVATENGKDGLNLIEKRQGIFSDETAIRQIIVTVVDKNSLYAAIETSEVSAYGLEVVQYTSKPIGNGTVVSVVS